MPDWDLTPELPPAGDRWTTWDAPGLQRGPEPYPAWLVTSLDACDDDLGTLKSGKEADVSVVRRSTADATCLLAAKRYRGREHKDFHRDGSYTDGRRVRKSREMRALANRTNFGRILAAGMWAQYEFATLVELYEAGFPVPYPVSYDGREILMEFVGTDDGVAAPRLAPERPDRALLGALFEQFREAYLRLAARGQAHGDLSPYNVLLDHDRLVIIDWPQVVDVVANPAGMEFLRRDAVNMCTWFAARGLEADAEAVFGEAVGLLYA